MFCKARGQISSIDLLVAILLFVLIFFSMRNIWIDNLSNALTESNKFQVQVLSNEALDLLLNTPGYPTNWTSQNVELIGLADKENVLNSTKVSIFKSMNYDTIKSKLALGLYEFSFDINSINPAYNEHIGPNLDSNSKVFSITRKVTYKGSEANVIFKVSTN